MCVIIVGCFDRFEEISVMDGIVDSPTSPPEGCSRHYNNNDGVDVCEAKCTENSNCDAYTFYSQDHPSTTWKSECIMCPSSVVKDNEVENEYATSGIKKRCDDDGNISQ